MKPFFSQSRTDIYKADFLECDAIPPSSVDLVVTSPPYDLSIAYADHNDTAPWDEYLKWTRQWVSKCHTLLKTDGRFCLNIPLDKNKGGQQSVCADLTNLVRDCGFKYQSTIIWNEGNISRRTAWGSWMSASAPYVIAPVEVIVVFYKEVWKKQNKGISDITKEEFIAWTNGIWTFNGESAKRIGHPAPYPLELPKRCIKLFSYVDDLVLDPFLGSGTTLVACVQNKRYGVGVELSEDYCRKAVERVSPGLVGWLG